MVYCIKCGAQMVNGSCPNCGRANSYTQSLYAYDHSDEFDLKDVSDNKVLAMACYLLGTIGVIIAMLGGQLSKYAAFHARQCLKITVIETLIIIIGAVFVWTGIVPIIAVIACFVLLVVRIICFVSICKGKSVEPPLIRSIGFMR